MRAGRWPLLAEAPPFQRPPPSPAGVTLPRATAMAGGCSLSSKGAKQVPGHRKRGDGVFIYVFVRLFFPQEFLNRKGKTHRMHGIEMNGPFSHSFLRDLAKRCGFLYTVTRKNGNVMKRN